MNNISVSIITVTYNSRSTISDTIQSVLCQEYPEIDYIIIDGGSQDGTIEIIKSFGSKISKFISEPDNGIYDAINKGIKLASGDVVGTLNSDDHFVDNYVVERISEEFRKNDCQALIGDVQFVSPENSSKIARFYSAKKFHTAKFKYGYMPPHPSFYVRKELYEKYGLYKTDYKIAADYELLIRFLYVNKVKYRYVEMPFVNMRTGGVSNRSFYSRYLLNKEILRACKENGIKTNYLNIYSKYLTKFFEYVGNNR